jgi:hypothetical protein
MEPQRGIVFPPQPERFHPGNRVPPIGTAAIVGVVVIGIAFRLVSVRAVRRDPGPPSGQAADCVT